MAHTFTKPGPYTVGVVVTDATGERDGGSVIVRAMTPEEAARVQLVDPGAKGVVDAPAPAPAP